MKNLIFVIGLVLSSCAFNPKLNKYPELIDGKVNYSLAVVKISKKWDLDQFEECVIGDSICLDGPPIALKVILSELIVGEELPPVFTMGTTDHYGGIDFDFYSKNQLWLVKVLSDGLGFIMPRYERMPIHRDLDKKLVLDMAGVNISWLPCFSEQLPISMFKFYDEEKNETYSVEGVGFNDFKKAMINQSSRLAEECIEN